MSELFDRIAPVYGLFYRYQKKHYRSVLNTLNARIGLDALDTAIDFGCGTGALCAALAERGIRAVGIDPARKMLAIAGKRNRDERTTFIQADGLQRTPFADEAFDFAIASYVAHGLNSGDRKKLYAEMARVARRYVILYDYNANRSRFTDMIESMEGGDYFNFIDKVAEELEERFAAVERVDQGSRAALYICRKN